MSLDNISLQKCLTLNLAELKKPEVKILKDKSRPQLPIAKKSNASFCVGDSVKEKLTQASLSRNQCDTEAKKPLKPNKAITTKTASTSGKCNMNKSNSMIIPIDNKIYQGEEEISELIDSNVVLKEITKRIWAKFLIEKVFFFVVFHQSKNAKVDKLSELNRKLKEENIKLKEINQKLILQQTKLKSSLIKCVDYLKEMSESADLNFDENNVLFLVLESINRKFQKNQPKKINI